jgi:hypothetical protein
MSPAAASDMANATEMQMPSDFRNIDLSPLENFKLSLEKSKTFTQGSAASSSRRL